MTRDTDKESISGKTIAVTKGNGLLAIEKVKEKIFMQMAASMKATGKMTCEMVKVRSFQPQV